MVVPTSFASAVLLLALAFFCFSLWPNFYRASERRWRFEFFSLDFSIGAILVAIVTAYTLGTLGPEMSFTDRMLIAGRAASVWVLGAGVVFALGNILLLASISLLGMAPAFAVSFGTATAVIAVIYLGRSHPLLLGGALACLVFCIICGLIGARSVVQKVVKQAASGNREAGRLTATSLAIASGLVLGGLQFVLRLTSDPEFGPGPYASILMLALGLLLSTPAFIFFFINIRLTGAPARFRPFAQGGLTKHVPGFVSGAIWAVGTLALLATLSTPGDQAPGRALIFLFPVSSGIACMLLGLFKWKELATGGPRSWLLLATLSFAAGCVFTAYGFGK